MTQVDPLTTQAGAHIAWKQVPDSCTAYLHVFNCGAPTGFSNSKILDLFSRFGAVAVHDPTSGRQSRVVVEFDSVQGAKQAISTWGDGTPCEDAGGRVFAMVYAQPVIKHKGTSHEHHAASTQTPVQLSIEEVGIPGLRMLSDFVSQQEEQALLRLADSQTWDKAARRRVQHYGKRFSYVVRGVDDASVVQPIPAEAQVVIQRIVHQQLLGQVDQLTVNEYTPGVGLTAHVDTHSAFQGAILSLSLAGDTVMEFRRPDAAPRALLLPPRSLLVMNGEARYAWHHYIPHRHGDWIQGQYVRRPRRRVSFTFRWTRSPETHCTCQYPDMCDSQGGGMPPTRLALLHENGNESPAAGVAGQAGSNGGADTVDGPQHAVAQPVQHNAAHSLLAASSEAPTTCRSATCVATQSPALHGMTCAAAQADFSISTQQPIEAAAPSGRSAEGPVEGPIGGRELEQAYVHQVYDIIAGHFSATRFAVWPKVREFLETLDRGAVIADVGCGNGKYFYVRHDVAVLGSDRSVGLAEVAARKLWGSSAVTAGRCPSGIRPHADIAVADALHLPYRPSVCDAAVCIAVLHHISTMQRRLHLLREIARVLKPGAMALVTVWALEQEDPKLLPKWHRITVHSPQSAPSLLNTKDQALGERCTSSLAKAGVESTAKMAASKAEDVAAKAESTFRMAGRGQAEEVNRAGEGIANGRRVGCDVQQTCSVQQANGTQPPRRDDATLVEGDDGQFSGGYACTTVPAAMPQQEPSMTDFFVPWHVPLHRADAGRAAAHVAAAQQGDSTVHHAVQPDPGRLETGPTAAPATSAGSRVSNTTQSVCEQHGTRGAMCGPGGAEGRSLGPTQWPLAGATVSGAPTVDKQKNSVVLQRYYHLFQQGELPALVTKLPELVCLREFYDKSNWCVIVQKATEPQVQ